MLQSTETACRDGYHGMSIDFPDDAARPDWMPTPASWAPTRPRSPWRPRSFIGSSSRVCLFERGSRGGGLRDQAPYEDDSIGSPPFIRLRRLAHGCARW
jgi:hypothetical protein